MHVTRLEARDIRCFERLALQPGPGLNLLTGANGAGKTSVLEALHLMAYGRSFRGRVRDGLVRSGQEALEVFVEWGEAGAGGRLRKAGLRHTGQAWEGRLDGAPVGQLSELCAALTVITFEPGSHALVDGGGEPRRRFLDWGLFHVEPDFFPIWRRYSRALKQRNALLKAGGSDALLDSWDRELAETGEHLARYRGHYLERLQPELRQMIARLSPALGEGRFDYQSGWRQADLALADALLLARPRDRAVGHTTVGPHRADWRVALSSAPNREALSRGQAKLVALCALMAQASAHAGAQDAGWPVIVLDDLASELDREHQQRVLAYLLPSGAQVFLTGTDAPAWPARVPGDVARFHVEHGEVRQI
jgi:DNA replication and repair protein RecF